MDSKVSTSTIARTIILILALINQVLTSTGHSVIPISNDQVQEIVSLVFTIISALVAWWKNNSFTAPAKQADEWMHTMKERVKKAK
jgi:SPP1 family holin